MGSKQATLFVEGMTCSACEARIGSALRKIEGVTDATASLRGGRVWVEYDEDRVGIDALRAAIEKAGYVVKEKRSAAGTTIALGIGVLLVAAYMIATQAGLFNALPKVDASIGYGMLFVVGLMTSVHCVAMCGGIALSQSIPGPGSGTGPVAGRLARLGPGLLYNGGRVISYTIVGAIVGALGAAFGFSPLIKGMIAAAAGLFMVVLGLKMLGIISKMPKLPRILPASFNEAMRRFGASLRKRGPFAVGLLNGLMPCGPLQTMQLYALGTGSAFAGALSMFIFSAGTVPLMLVFGLAAAFLPRKVVPVMVRASAVLVMFLGVVTFARAASLAGIALPTMAVAKTTAASAGSVLVSDSAAISDGRLEAKMEGGVQTVTTIFGANNYRAFVVRPGLPLKWTIRIRAEDINGCNGTMIVPSYGIRKKLKPGDNLVEFTPKSAGVIAYSCWMGMIRSSITVLSDPSWDAPSLQDRSKLPPEAIGIPLIKDGVQEISINVSSRGYSPAAIVLQKGMKAVIRFKAEELTSCNYQVIFPEYNGGLDLSKGQLETPPIPITADFTFQCGMGMLHGYVKTVDDLSKIDMKKIKAEIDAYRASGGSGGGGCCGGGSR
ncbi:MAG: sulfite exporter TauE/SafE family protein [Rectinemataceae bacterium]|jgi:sulfite exporter TauE/SafE/plastocyanin domain-containing protein/copper chaperone CopZ